MDLNGFMADVEARSPGEPEFHQAVREFAEKVLPIANADARYADARVLERMVEPDRVIMFRVVWESDAGEIQVNRGYRVQFNNAIGPYKGGLRFDPSVNLSILKFLGFEQTFKNSLTTLPMGGAKGGSDFDPKGRSDEEVMRFCQSFMTGLYRYIGKDVDVPAGDIGVGAREVGYLFGQFKRIQNEWSGTLTGKGVSFGGSPLRTEATGYGCVYFAREILARVDGGLEGRTCVISGSGNVAQYTAEKLVELGARVVTLSDRQGFVHDPEGITLEKVRWVEELKTSRHGSLDEYPRIWGGTFHAGAAPWSVPCDVAFPCATQNELDADDARRLLANGCRLVCEGANMPVTYEASKVLEAARVAHAPGKAANAGGVAISGLEMSQNAMRMSWTREEVDQRLRRIMRQIHEHCVEQGYVDDGWVDYVRGANVAGFLKVAEAMLALGIV
ncbi:MAG TPA: NADP-specific glutamate dehydrogenase [Gemmatimonadota bacterium]|nr:NADP-specific glutamate dehydrogenase [Gemmatimonadota bacterium]